MQTKHGYSKDVIGRDMYSDNTLRHMTKSELIELLMIAQHNYEAVLESYGNAVAYSEKLLKHGKWKRVKGMNSKCSECNRYFPVTEFSTRPFDINYCPNCGARMDGDTIS